MRCIFKKRPDCGETCIAASDAVASAFLISLEALIYKEKCRNGETERRSEEHTSELQSLMRISYAVFCLKKKIQRHNDNKKKVRNMRTTTTKHDEYNKNTT